MNAACKACHNSRPGVPWLTAAVLAPPCVVDRHVPIRASTSNHAGWEWSGGRRRVRPGGLSSPVVFQFRRRKLQTCGIAGNCIKYDIIRVQCPSARRRTARTLDAKRRHHGNVMPRYITQTMVAP